jgi:hypothetical protein
MEVTTDTRTKAQHILAQLPGHGSHHQGFWEGDGDSLLGKLLDMGWKMDDVRASYYWCLRHPSDDSKITYVEGDLYEGNALLDE